MKIVKYKQEVFHAEVQYFRIEMIGGSIKWTNSKNNVINKQSPGYIELEDEYQKELKRTKRVSLKN